MASASFHEEADDWVDLSAMMKNQLIMSESTATDREREAAEDKFFDTTSDTALSNLRRDAAPAFTVDVPKGALWEAFMLNLPPSIRNRYSCYVCRQFIENCARLVQVDQRGQLTSLLWPVGEDDAIPEHFRAPIRAVRAKALSADIHGDLKVNKKAQSQGARTKGGFNHFHLMLPDFLLRKDVRGYAPPSVGERAIMLRRIIDDFDLDTVRAAATMITENKLSGPDNHKAAIRWFLEVRGNGLLEPHSCKRTRKNLLYLHAATAYTGCINALRNGALSTLLENIKDGKDFDTIKKQWGVIVHPLQYQRPQAAPKLTQVLAAERLMEDLGVTANDLRRRQLSMAEIPDAVKIWHKSETQKRTLKPGGLFSNVDTKAVPAKTSRSKLELPPSKISFTKLITDILPKATKLEYKLATHNTICFCITGYEKTAPIMQWHNEDNKASWFVYHNPDPVQKHNLVPNAWNAVSCIIPKPHLWDGAPLTTTFPLVDEKSNDLKHYHKSHGFSYLLCLENVTLNDGRSLCLFPAMLKAEFRGIRSTIEAYSKKGEIEKSEDLKEKGGLVAGIVIYRSSSAWSDLLRVTDKNGGQRTYEIALFE